MQWKLLISLFLALFVAIFALQNSDLVIIIFLGSTTKISQSLIIILSATLGALLSLFLGLFKQFSLSKSIKEKDKKIRNLESEISSLKVENKPLEPKEDEEKVKQYGP